MAREANVSATARVNDQASPKLKAIGKEAQRMGQGFAKSAAAMRLVGGAAAEVGGPLGNAGDKALQLASTLATGGPLGIAMVGITLAAAAAAAAYKILSAESEGLERGNKIAAESLAKAAARVAEHRNRLAELEKQIRNVGKTTREVTQGEMRDDIARREFGIKLLEREIEQRRARVEAAQAELATMKWSEQMQHAEKEAWLAKHKALTKVAEEEGSLLKIQEAGFVIGQKNLVNLYSEVDALGRKAEAEDKLEAKQRAAAAAARKRKETAARLERELEKAARDRGRATEEAWRRGVSAATASYLRRLELEQKNAEFLAANQDAEEKRAGELAEKKQELAQGVATTAIEAAGMIAAAHISGSETEKEAAVQAAIVSITTALAKGAAEAIAAHAGIPFVGPALGAAFAAIIAGMILAARKGFAHGGVVTGGTPGKDSVPIMASPGEVVIPAGLARELGSVMSSRGPRRSSGNGYATGGTVAASGGAGTTTHIHVSLNAIDADSVTERSLNKLALKIAQKQETHRARGRIRSER